MDEIYELSSSWTTLENEVVPPGVYYRRKVPSHTHFQAPQIPASQFIHLMNSSSKEVDLTFLRIPPGGGVHIRYPSPEWKYICKDIFTKNAGGDLELEVLKFDSPREAFYTGSGTGRKVYDEDLWKVWNSEYLTFTYSDIVLAGMRYDPLPLGALLDMLG